MTAFVRTPDANFADLKDFDFPPIYHVWQDLRIHYLDVGPKDGAVALLLHGMPTWSYLYRTMIPPLVEAGYRCIAPDHMGFGRSDKPTDIHWYTIARHQEILSTLIKALDLQDITLFCQDWGGPIGLAQAVMSPDRFSRLVIMNTWLHHADYQYTDAIKNWNRSWHKGGRFCREKPDMGLMMVMNAGLIGRADFMAALERGTPPAMSDEAMAMYRAYRAPVDGLEDDAYNGMRRFPLSIPVDSWENGNGAMQEHCYETLLQWTKPVNFIWGCADDVFTEAWGREWARRMGATFDPIEAAGHFLQNTHGAEVAKLMLSRI